MANRALIDGPNGLIKISKPSKNVLTAGDVDLLFSSQRKTLQVLASGSVLASSLTWISYGDFEATISHPTLPVIGYAQIAPTSGQMFYRFYVVSQTVNSITFRAYPKPNTGNIVYTVTNLKVN